MKTADIVIIGGGIFGTNLAYALATHGATNILLLEQDVLAAGSSGKATGGLRQQFADELDIRFSIEGIHFYERFTHEYVPANAAHRPPSFDQYGYMFLCSTQESWQSMRVYVERQRALGVPTQLLTPAEVSARVPQLVIDDLLGATFCPTDGYSDPGAMARALAWAASELGVSIQEHTPVTTISVRQGRVESVSTPDETIATPIVVNASGVYASLVARLAGITDLPVWPLKRQLYQTEVFDGLPADLPMVVDVETGFHFRRRDGGITLAMPLPVSAEQVERNRRLEPEAFEADLDPTLWPLLQSEIRRRCPALGRATIRRAWAGFYEMTPDEHPIIGPTEIAGFFCGCGFSGHGFMHAPGAARLLTECLLGTRDNTSDLEMFSLERFRTGKLIVSASLL
jgi:sarcosine oxidase subunit beta